jgi:uncharacterized protein
MTASLDLRKRVSSQRDQIQALADLHGVHRVRLFGSVARGDAAATSDIDFLVEMDTNRGLLDQAAFMVALRDLLGVDVDVVSENGIKARYKERILAEAVGL